MKEYAQNTKQLTRTIQGSGRNQKVGFVDNRVLQNKIANERSIDMEYYDVCKRFNFPVNIFKTSEIQERIAELLRSPYRYRVTDITKYANTGLNKPLSIEEGEFIGYHPVADIDTIYGFYTAIGGLGKRGQLGTVCNKTGKPGGHFTDSTGKKHVMYHDSQGLLEGGDGRSITAWKIEQYETIRVVGVGYHKGVNYYAIFPNTREGTINCGAQVEVFQT